MKLSTKISDMRLQGVEEGISFGLENIKMASHVLSTNIYSDNRRQEAVLREFTTNAQDSHIEAGIGHMPLRVHMPTEAEPYLTIEDYGLGLTPFQVGDLLGNFFRSESNLRELANGFFGVGSKSPFSYTSMYTVEAFKDGEHCLYQFYKDESDTPRYTPLIIGTTDRPNGVIVKIPVEIKDIEIFEKEAIKLYQHTLVIPEFTGNDISSAVRKLKDTTKQMVTIEGENWKYFAFKDKDEIKTFDKAFNHCECNSVVLGSVSYPLDLEAMANSPHYGLRDVNLKGMKGLVLELDIATEAVNFETGREKLQYTEQTCRVIENRIRALVTFAQNHLEQVSKNMTDWDKMAYINDHMGGNRIMTLALKGQNTESIQYKDIQMGNIEVKLLQLDQHLRMTSLRFDHESRENKKRAFGYFLPRESLKVFVKTNRKINRDTLGNYMASQRCRLLVIEGERGKAISMNEAEHLLRQFGNPTVLTEQAIKKLDDDEMAQFKQLVDQAQMVPMLKQVREIVYSRYNLCRAKENNGSVLLDYLNTAMATNKPVYYYLKKTKRSAEMPERLTMLLALELGLVMKSENDNFSGLIAVDERTLALMSSFTCLRNIDEEVRAIADNSSHPKHRIVVRTMISVGIDKDGDLNSLRLDYFGDIATIIKDLVPNEKWKIKAVTRLKAISKSQKAPQLYDGLHQLSWVHKTIAYKSAVSTIKRLKDRAKPFQEMIEQYPLLHILGDHRAMTTEKKNGAIRSYVGMVISSKVCHNVINFKETKAA